MNFNWSNALVVMLCGALEQQTVVVERVGILTGATVGILTTGDSGGGAEYTDYLSGVE